MRPLIVRLRNWVGDVTLSVPGLQQLADAGYSLRLIGKRWAGDLLAGHGWPVEVLPGSMRDRIALLRRMRSEARRDDPGLDRRINALCFPYSFSSALEFRLAGLRASGFAYEGRGWLLSRALPRPDRLHELEVYWTLTSELSGMTARPPPQRIDLRVSGPHAAQADALRRRHGIERDCILICPFAGGTFSDADKTWPGFAAFAAARLPALGRTVVVCPGPGEETLARERFASARCLENLDLGTYAALLKDAALMISNDTGPGHIAAAVGTPLVSVLGPSEPEQWRAWGPSVRIVRGTPDDGSGGWPDEDRVFEAAAAALR